MGLIISIIVLGVIWWMVKECNDAIEINDDEIIDDELFDDETDQN